jgi:hypothetical protein
MAQPVLGLVLHLTLQGQVSILGEAGGQAYPFWVCPAWLFFVCFGTGFELRALHLLIPCMALLQATPAKSSRVLRCGPGNGA